MPIALAQVKAGNIYENLLKEIRQTMYSLYREKEITKNVCKHIMNSVELSTIYNTTDIMFMNSENSKTSDPHKLLLNLSDKTNLKISDKFVTLSNFSIYQTWKNIKTSYKNNKFKISAPT